MDNSSQSDLIFQNLQFRTRRIDQHSVHMILTLKMKEMLMHRAKRQIEVYETLDDFVKDESRKISPIVKLENIKNLFLYLISILMVVSLLSITHVSVQTIAS